MTTEKRFSETEKKCNTYTRNFIISKATVETCWCNTHKRSYDYCKGKALGFKTGRKEAIEEVEKIIEKHDNCGQFWEHGDNNSCVNNIKWKVRALKSEPKVKEE